MRDAAHWGTSSTQFLHDTRGEWRRPVLTVLVTTIVALSVPVAATPVAAHTAATQDDAEAAPNDVLLVDDDGTQCPNASYDAIQPALDDSAPGDTVLVCRGTYTDNVSVDTPGITLKAANENVVLDGEDRLRRGVHVQASGVTVDGLTVRDYESAGIAVESDEPLADVRVTDNDVTTDSSILPGIYVDGARGAKVSGNRVTDSGSGIWLNGSRDTTVRNNELTDYTYIGILESANVTSLWAEPNRIERRLGEFDAPAEWERRETITAQDVRFDAPNVTRRTPEAATSGALERSPDDEQRGPDVTRPAVNLSARPAELNASLTGRRSLYALPDNRTVSTRALSTGSDDPRVAPTNNTIATNDLTAGSIGIASHSEVIGIASVGGQDGTIRSNTVSGGNAALIVDGALAPEVRNNRLTDSRFGLRLRDADRALLRNNRMADNEYNLDVTGSYDHDIDRSNRVDGAPVLYLNGADDCLVQGPTEYGYVGIVNAENVTVRDVTMEKQGNGLHLSNVDGALVENVTLANNYEGIRVQASDDVTVRDIEAHNNSVGVYTRDGRGIRVTDSRLHDNPAGVISTHRGNTAQSTATSAPGTIVSDTSISAGYVGALYNASTDSPPRSDRFVDNVVTTTGASFSSAGFRQEFGGDVEIADNEFEGGGGVRLVAPSGGVTVRDNAIRTDNSGVQNIQSNGTITVRNNDIRAEYNGISSDDSEGAVTIRNNDIRAEYNGISSDDSEGAVTIRNNDIRAEDNGIGTSDSEGAVTIRDNDIRAEYEGIETYRSVAAVTIRDNDIQAGEDGLLAFRPNASVEIRSNTVEADNTGIASVATDGGGDIVDNEIGGGRTGMALLGSTSHRLRDNTITGADAGFRVTRGYDHNIDRSNTVDGDPIYYLRGETGTSVTGEDDPGYVAVVDSTDVTVRDLAVDGGLPVAGSQAVTVRNVTVRNARDGIRLADSRNSRVSGARVTGERIRGDGIVVRSCEDCTIPSVESAGNEIVDNHVSVPDDGIIVRSSTGDTVVNNTVRSSRIGAASLGTEQVRFTNNRITGGYLGLVLAGARRNVLRNNSMTDTEDGFRVLGGYEHDIDRSNTVGGDPIYYLRGETGTSVTGEDDPGYVAVVDSTDVTVRNVTLHDVSSLPVVGSRAVSVANASIPRAIGGIQLVNTQDSVVRDSRVDNTQNSVGPESQVDGVGRFGVAIRRCETCLSGSESGNNEIRNVEVSDASYGIVAANSSDDAVTDSEVTDSTRGIVLAETDDTTIRRNDISDGRYGVLVRNDDPTATTVASIDRNTITDNRRGVVLDADDCRVAVVENTIVRNGLGIYVRYPVSETGSRYDLHRNHLDNDRYGVSNGDGDFVVNATGNYWGAADGPSSFRTEALEDPKTGALADGSGDAVSRGDEAGVSNVRFDPFLTAPPSAAPAPPAENDSAA